MITKLYDFFQPQHYKLSLNINSEKLVFNGNVHIKGTIVESASLISLHAKNLKITEASINGKPVEPEFEDDVLSLTVESKLQAGEVELSVSFSGVITDAMHGMYPCYFEHEGKRKKLIATQFESHHAREVFPCIDEPAAKATFDLELTTTEGETVLANTPEARRTTNEGRQTVVFETTPKMSTYLLAFVTGEMVKKEAKTKDGVVVRCWASAAQGATWLDYSVKETVDLIEFYNDYFGVPYPLTKCDQVALPDFESGAMENWGLITYRETVLLSDPKNPSLSTQQWITLVVAHELSHQWFGNLVTMQWWDDLWLNESFANMTEYLATDRLHPEWQIWEEFVAADSISATNRDVYKDVQAVRVEVDNPAEIHTLFDPSIVYAKGGKLLKMLHDLLGDDAWRKGLKNYFETHQYGNTSRDDLWESLAKVSEINVPELMNGWIEQPGQPLVSVSQSGSALTLSQRRLLLDGEDTHSSWQIPLLAEGVPELLTAIEQTIQLSSTEPVLLNQSGIGHYITNYTETSHKQWLAQHLIKTDTPSAWKITHLNGLVMQARHGDTTIAEALATIQNAGQEPRAAVWSQISSIIGNARMIIEDNDELEAVIKRLAYKLSQHHLERLGWSYHEDEPSNDVHLRTTVIGLAIASENDSIIQQAMELYKTASNLEDLPAEIRSMLMGVAIRFGEASEFDRLIELYKNSANAEFKVDIAAALCSTKQPAQAEQLTQLLLDTNVIRTQDTIRWYIYLLRNRYVRDIAWRWLRDNWNWVLDNFGGSKSYDDFARYSASVLNSTAHLQQYKAFFEPKADDPALKRAIKIGVNELQAKSQWRERDRVAVTEWLTQYAQENL